MIQLKILYGSHFNNHLAWDAVLCEDFLPASCFRLISNFKQQTQLNYS